MDNRSLRFEAILAEIDGYIPATEVRINQLKEIFRTSFFETVTELRIAFADNKISESYFDKKIVRLMACWAIMNEAIERIDFDEKF